MGLEFWSTSSAAPDLLVLNLDVELKGNYPLLPLLHNTGSFFLFPSPTRLHPSAARSASTPPDQQRQGAPPAAETGGAAAGGPPPPRLPLRRPLQVAFPFFQRCASLCSGLPPLLHRRGRPDGVARGDGTRRRRYVSSSSPSPPAPSPALVPLLLHINFHGPLTLDPPTVDSIRGTLSPSPPPVAVEQDPPSTTPPELPPTCVDQRPPSRKQTRYVLSLSAFFLFCASK